MTSPKHVEINRVHKAHEEHLSHLYPQAHTHRLPHSPPLCISHTHRHIHIAFAAGACVLVKFQGWCWTSKWTQASSQVGASELKQPEALEVSCPWKMSLCGYHNFSHLKQTTTTPGARAKTLKTYYLIFNLTMRVNNKQWDVPCLKRVKLLFF